MIINGTPYIFLISLGYTMSDSNVQIWKYNKDTYFHGHQILHETNARTIDTIYYNGNYYLAIGLSRKANLIFPGLVIIQK